MKKKTTGSIKVDTQGTNKVVTQGTNEEGLGTMQRIYQISPSPEPMDMLMNMDSAFDMVSMSEENKHSNSSERKHGLKKFTRIIRK